MLNEVKHPCCLAAECQPHGSWETCGQGCGRGQETLDQQSYCCYLVIHFQVANRRNEANPKLDLSWMLF